MEPLGSTCVRKSDTASIDRRDSLPLPVKLAYAAGALAESVKAFSFGLFLIFFYVSVRGLAGTLVGTATAIVLVWDALVDPVVGRLSDRSRSRFGRRHSFMLCGALLMLPTFYAIFAPPASLAGAGLAAWLIASNLLLRTAQSIFSVPYYALGAELSSNYHERTTITGIRAIVAMAGTMAAVVLSFLIFFQDSPSGLDPKFEPDSYSGMALSFGLLMAAGGLVATFGTLGQRDRLRKIDGEQDRGGSIWTDLRLILRNRPFLLLTLSNSLFFHAVVINATLAMHYLTYYAVMPDSKSISVFQAGFYCGALAGAGLWMRLAKFVDKHRLYFVSIIGTAAVMAAAYFAVGEGRLFGTGSLIPLTLGHAMAGLFAAALWVLPASMVADTMDEQKRMTGSREGARMFGVFSLAHQVAASLALAVSGYLVEHFARLAPGQVGQSALTIDRIGALYGLFPSAILLLSAVLILPYPLTAERLRQIQAQIERNQDDRPGDIENPSLP